MKFSSELNTEHSDREKKIQKIVTLKQNILHEKMNKLTTLLLLLILVVSFAKDSTSRFIRSMRKKTHSCSDPRTTNEDVCKDRRHGLLRKQCHYCGKKGEIDERYTSHILKNQCVSDENKCKVLSNWKPHKYLDVEAINRILWDISKNEFLVHVRWSGYGPKDDSDVPLQDVYPWSPDLVEKFLKSENGAVKLSPQEQEELWSRVDKLKKHKYELDIIKLHLYPSRDPIEVKIHLENDENIYRYKVPAHAKKFHLRNMPSPVRSLEWYYVASKDWESK